MVIKIEYPNGILLETEGGRSMEDQTVTYFTPAVPLDFGYNYRVGPYIEKYLDGLREKRIMGVKCADCDAVLVPPRMFCGDCDKRLEDWVEVAPQGTLENFTVGHVTMTKGKLSPADPYVLGMIRLDGATSLLLAKVEKVAPADLRKGIRLRAVWNDAAENEYFLLDHFEPV
jgi:uncharacterized OB-fold protein